MRKNYLYILLFWFVSFNNSFADSPNSTNFELNSLMHKSFGKNETKYQELYKNTHTQMRYPELLEHKDNLYLFDNFRIRSEKNKATGAVTTSWSNALLDIDKLRKVSFVVGTFDITLDPLPNKPTLLKTGHAQMLYEFSEGGIITPYGETDGMVISFEAYRGKDVKYDGFKGLSKSYGSIFVIGSYEDAVQKAAYSYDSLVLLELSLSDAQKKELLKASLTKALDKAKLEEDFYNTFNNSCISNQITLLNLILPDENKIREEINICGLEISTKWEYLNQGHLLKALRSTTAVSKETTLYGEKGIAAELPFRKHLEIKH